MYIVDTEHAPVPGLGVVEGREKATGQGIVVRGCIYVYSEHRECASARARG